jgi:hypothetical protein
MSTDLQDLGGILTISILSAKLYRDTDTFDKMDPFAQIKY